MVACTNSIATPNNLDAAAAQSCSPAAGAEDIALPGRRVAFVRVATDGVLGAATIDGTGSAWNIGGDLNMAASSLASLTIIDNGTVNVAGTLTIGSDGAGEDALVSLAGGTLNVGGLVPDGTFDWSSGSLGFTGPGGFTVGPGGDLGDNFTLDAGTSIDVANLEELKG